MSFHANSEPSQMFRVASFDGGGPGCLFQLSVLRAIMARVELHQKMAPDTACPADYFDVMGGVGFGAYCALLLGRLGMTPIEAILELCRTVQEIFSDATQKSPQMMTGSLRSAVEGVLDRRGLPLDLKLYDKATKPRCRIVAFAAPEASMSNFHTFRSYRARAASTAYTFVDATCAVLAYPKIFSPVRIETLSLDENTVTQGFVGTPYGMNNPIHVVLDEVKLLSQKEDQISLILSFGSGKIRHFDIDMPDLAALFALDSEQAEQDLQNDPPDAERYLRFNIDIPVDKIRVDQWPVENLERFISEMQAKSNTPEISQGLDLASEILVRSRDKEWSG